MGTSPIFYVDDVLLKVNPEEETTKSQETEENHICRVYKKSPKGFIACIFE